MIHVHFLPSSFDLHMGRSKELSPFTHGRIVQAHKEGHTVREIVKDLDIPRSTVGDTLKRFEKCGTAESAPQSGRPTVNTPRTTRRVLRDVCAKVQHGYWNTRVPVVGTRQARVPARHGYPCLNTCWVRVTAVKYHG